METSEVAFELTGVNLPAHIQQHGNYLWWVPRFVPSMCPKIHFNETEFIAKEELHVTLCSLHKLCKYFAEQRDIEQKAATEGLVKAFRAMDWDVFGSALLVHRLSLAQEGSAKTIIGEGDLTGFFELYNHLASSSKINFPTPPIHVTLYTLSNRLPVGLANPYEYLSFVERLDRDKQDELAQKIGTKLPVSMLAEAGQ